MQLSSLFLSAAALLAQVASAEKYALISTVLDPTEYGPARVKSSSAEASVGFENANLPVAKIPLDDGDIGAEFFCKTVGPGKWALLAKNDKEGSNPVSEHDIAFTGPFIINEDFHFVYDGEEKLEWAVCDMDEANLYLFSPSVGVESACNKTNLYTLPARFLDAGSQ